MEGVYMPIFFRQQKNQKLLFRLLTGFSLTLLILLKFINTINKESDDQKMTSPLHTPSVSISHIDFLSDIYLEHIDMSIVIESKSKTELNETVYIGFSIISPTKDVIDFPVVPLSLKNETDQKLSLSYSLDNVKHDSIISGPYEAVIAIWDKPLEKNSSSQLDRIEVNHAFRLYNINEDFQTLDRTIWHSRQGRLGRTKLKDEHVTLVDNILTITHPAGTLEGGEIQTIDLQHYGSYEISMKLPNAPSSITGFFLYSPPDFYHEIDIEVFNQPDSEIWFTSYIDGAVHHETKTALDFDPTANFHKYRIDYYPHEVRFYIDGVAVKTWEDGFSQKPMHLMVNSWFPEWLPGTEPKNNETLQIDWIRF